MPTIIDQLVDQLRRSTEGGAWHGPSVREALDGVTATGAATRTIAGAHTIWEIVLHLRGSYELVLRRLDGNDAPLTPTEDWPAPHTSSVDQWDSDVASLFDCNRRIREAVTQFPVARLFEPLIANPPYSAFTQFIGLTQHDLYHAGQIILLKRAERAGVKATPS
ncbi:MAG: DinB family protein [bacterium]